MSTAPPKGTSTDATHPTNLSLPLEISENNESNDVASTFTDGMTAGVPGVRLAPASERFYHRVDGQHAPSTTHHTDDGADLHDVLEDTHSFRVDDTMIALRAAQLKANASQSDAAKDSASTLTLDAPAASGPLNGLFYDSLKRCLDIVISAAALIVISPLLLVAAVIIKLTDGGSVFYPHTRVGEGGSEFTCYKFRSMVVNAENMKADLAFYNSHDDDRTFKIPNDPRVTPFGRFMRRMSIDELPQLWNVLKGDMSIVGPRPPVVSEVEQYTWDDMQRLAVKPGLTCIWQVSGRSRLPFPEQLKMDLEYIENRSFALDVKLIVLTIPAVVSADGAY